MIKQDIDRLNDNKALEPLPLVRAIFLALIKKYPNSSGYFLNKKILEFFDGEIELKSGTIYNELRKMEKMGLVTSILEDSKRKTRLYVINEKGERELNKLRFLISNRARNVLIPLLKLMGEENFETLLKIKD